MPLLTTDEFGTCYHVIVSAYTHALPDRII